ncbi:unnamed protein product [Merluccius merluccius]
MAAGGSRLVHIHNLGWLSPTTSPSCRRMLPSILTLHLLLPPHLALKPLRLRLQPPDLGCQPSWERQHQQNVFSIVQTAHTSRPPVPSFLSPR